MKRLVTTSVISFACALTLACTAYASVGPRVSEAGSPRFPDRAFILSLPAGHQVPANAVHVRENGGPVTRLSVVPARALGKSQLGVVLVIDASSSMHGKAIADAVAAARAFVAQRNPQQEVGIIAFNSRPRMLLRPTTDAGRIQAVLSQVPAVAGGTRIYDALAAAVASLNDAHVDGGSVVLLSDGADTGSHITEAAATAAGRAAHVRVFSVGLRSRAFDPAALRRLASDGHGEFSEASSSEQLAGVFHRLGSELANQYVVRYRSLAGPRARVRVQVTATGIAGAATRTYISPALRPGVAPPFHRPLATALWDSPAAVAGISFAAAFLLVGAVMALVRPRSRSLRRRIAAFVPSTSDDDRHALTEVVGDRLLRGAERSLERTSWWPGFKLDLEVARIRMPAVQIVISGLVATLAAMWVLSAITGSAFSAVLGLTVPLAIRAWVHGKLGRQRKLFAEQLADNLQVVASAMRAGHSFAGALSVALADAPEPTRNEFERVVADERLGVPLEDALAVLARRMNSPDLDQVALVAKIQRQTGGNSAEVLDRVTDTIRERQELRRVVKTLTAQGRLSRWIMTAVPVFLLVVVSSINPGYMDPLLHSATGKLLLVIGTVMVISGSLVIKRIVDIEV